MCGIAGMVDFNVNLRGKRKILCDMVKTLERRGPDSEGLYESENVLLGHRRLIVVDPDGGKQPMIKISGIFLSKSLWIAFSLTAFGR